MVSINTFWIFIETLVNRHHRFICIWVPWIKSNYSILDWRGVILGYFRKVLYTISSFSIWSFVLQYLRRVKFNFQQWKASCLMFIQISACTEKPKIELQNKHHGTFWTKIFTCVFREHPYLLNEIGRRTIPNQCLVQVFFFFFWLNYVSYSLATKPSERWKEALEFRIWKYRFRLSAS